MNAKSGYGVRHNSLESLGRRRQPRPRTQRFLPHKQLDQWPNPAVFKQLEAACMALPDVRGQQSRMAGDDTRALWLPDSVVFGPPAAFIDDHEFCHLHALPEGNLHLTLPSGVREHVVQMAWGEAHPSAAAGLLGSTLIMVYAPRNEAELAAVLAIVQASYQFARGTPA